MKTRFHLFIFSIMVNVFAALLDYNLWLRNIILQMKSLLLEATRCIQEEKHLAVTLEYAKWELADSEKELKWLKSAVTSSEKESDQIQKDLETIQTELDTER